MVDRRYAQNLLVKVSIKYDKSKSKQTVKSIAKSIAEIQPGRAQYSAVIARMEMELLKTLPTQKNIDIALLKIGMMIAAKAKLKARQQKIIDRGHLINSIRYELFRYQDITGVYVGSWGVVYAAMNEFGGPVSQRQFRAMMKALSERGANLPSKHIVKKSGSAWRWKPRPYLRPAFTEGKQYIIDTLRSELNGK